MSAAVMPCEGLTAGREFGKIGDARWHKEKKKETTFATVRARQSRRVFAAEF